MFKDRWENWYF